MCLIVCGGCFCVFYKQKTAYEMRISDWSADVCSSDLLRYGAFAGASTCSNAARRKSRYQDDQAPHHSRGRRQGRRLHCDGFQGDRPNHRDRKRVVEGKSVSVRVALGGRRIRKNKEHEKMVHAREVIRGQNTKIT